jgi:tetratricopeptide (TPR) repeat protein
VHVRSDDYEEAGRYFEYVLDRTDDEATRRAIAAERAKIDLDSGDFEAVVETAARVLGVEDDSPSPAVCRLLARQANAHSAMGEVSAAREVAERALEMARALESAELRALVLKVKGSIEFRHENPERAIEIGERAASAAEDADAVRILAAVYNNMAGAFAQIGDSARSVDAYENSRERWQAVGNRVGEAVPLGNLGFMLTRMGRFEEAHAVLERSVAMGERLGMDGHLVFQWSFLGELALNRGDVPRAREFAERSLSAAESLSIEPSVASARVMLGRICRLEDDDERAREHVEYVLETADSVQEEAASEARYHRGQLLREQGDVERALALHEESLESPREDGHWKAPVYQYLGLAGAQIDAGAVESAVENAECALDRVAETENVVMALAARTVLGQAKHAAADTDEARTLLRDVIADARSLGSKSYECQARTALGSVLAESGSVLKARRVLEPAVSIGEDAGLALFVRRAREILDDLDG